MRTKIVCVLMSLVCIAARSRAQSKPEAARLTAPTCAASGRFKPICGLHGPEDIELLPDGRHAIVSELPANMKHSDLPGWMLVDLHSHTVMPLPIDSRPEAGWGEAACTAPSRNFGTHGIHLAKRSDGRLQLLAVNHDERESIEAFEIVPSGTSFRAVWHGCARYSEGVFNDVTSIGDGSFVAVVTMSNADHECSDIIDLMTSGKNTGWVVEWTPAAGFRRLPNSDVPTPGGVQLSPNSQSIYYTSWSGKDIRLYDRLQHRVVKTTKVEFNPDNLSMSADGKLLVAGLDHIESWRECFTGKSAFCNELHRSVG